MTLETDTLKFVHKYYLLPPNRIRNAIYTTVYKDSSFSYRNFKGKYEKYRKNVCDKDEDSER